MCKCIYCSSRRVSNSLRTMHLTASVSLLHFAAERQTFIHSGYLYSAPSRNLLRGALSQATPKHIELRFFHITLKKSIFTTVFLSQFLISPQFFTHLIRKLQKVTTTTVQFNFFICTFPFYNCTNCDQSQAWINVKICPVVCQL